MEHPSESATNGAVSEGAVTATEATQPTATAAGAGATSGGRPGLNQFRNATQGSYEQAQQRAAERAAEEREAAIRAKEKALELAEQNRQAAADSAKAAAEAAEEMKDLPPAALAGAAQNNMQRVEGQYAANKAMMMKNKEALDQTRSEAQRRMEEVQGAGRQALETAAAATVDIARGEFEARCAKVLEQEGKLRVLAEEVDRREKQLRMLRGGGEPNWPCNCCCFSPLVHHHIKEDIPRFRQSFMKKAYANYWFTCFLLLANFALALVMVFIKDQKDHGLGGDEKSEKDTKMIQHAVVSGIMCVGWVFAFVLWYWPSYKAIGSGSPGQYLGAKFGLVVAVFFNLLVTLGPLGYGGCGIFYGLHVQTVKGGNAFIAVIVNAVLWGIQIFVFCWMWIRVRRYGKQDGATPAKAQMEAMAGEAMGIVGL